MKLVERETLAGRLLISSAKASFDPAVEVDWDAPEGGPRSPGLPLHRSSLYGTDLWASMGEQQRIKLTRHEASSIASVGVWFELILISMLARHVYEQDPQSQHAQYALTEIADECRHSIMFGRMTQTLGCPAYGPGRKAHRLGKLFRATASPAEIFAGALFVEELLDALQREAMKDPAVAPLVRQVMRIHVTEEARHMRYASQELARQLATVGGVRRWITAVRLAAVCVTAAQRLVHPRVYGAAGLDISAAKSAALANPRWRATKTWAARKVMAEFGELGLLDAAPARWIYRRGGLLPAAAERSD